MAKKKKAFSPAQLRAQELFATRSKAGTLKKKTKSAGKKAKTVIKKVIKRKSMPKRTMIRRSSSGKFGIKIPSIVKKAAAGAGLVALVTTAANALGQGQLVQSPVAKAVIGFVGGDIVGAATAFVTAGGIGNGGQQRQDTGGFA